MDEKQYTVIERGDEEAVIKVPFRDQNLQFSSTILGPFSYLDAGNALRTAGLQAPKAEETVALLHAMYCGPEKFRENSYVKKLSDKRTSPLHIEGLWIPNLNLWQPRGVMIKEDLEMNGRWSETELEPKMLAGPGTYERSNVWFSNDRSVRSVERDRILLQNQVIDGCIVPVNENGFVIGTFGIEGSDQLEELVQPGNPKSPVSSPAFVGGGFPQSNLDLSPSTISYRINRFEIDGIVPQDQKAYTFGVISE